MSNRFISVHGVILSRGVLLDLYRHNQPQRACTVEEKKGYGSNDLTLLIRLNRLSRLGSIESYRLFMI